MKLRLKFRIIWFNPRLKFDFLLWVIKNIYRHLEAPSDFGRFVFYHCPGRLPAPWYVFRFQFQIKIHFVSRSLLSKKNRKIFSKKFSHSERAWHDHTHFLAKIKVVYFNKIHIPSSSLWSIKIFRFFSAILGHTHFLAKIHSFSELFSARMGHPEGWGRATPILKYFSYSENYYKKGVAGHDTSVWRYIYDLMTVNDISKFEIITSLRGAFYVALIGAKYTLITKHKNFPLKIHSTEHVRTCITGICNDARLSC